jgi:hypothetical protein
MPPKKTRCSTCLRNFSPGGYKQHFLYPKNVACKLARDETVGLVGEGNAEKLDNKNLKFNEIANSFLDAVLEGRFDNKRNKKKAKKARLSEADTEEEYDKDDKYAVLPEQDEEVEEEEEMEDEDQDDEEEKEKEEEDDDDDGMIQQSDYSSIDGSLPAQIDIEINSSLVETFDDYKAWAMQNCGLLQDEEFAGAELMEIIHKKRAPLNTYEVISKWRKKHSKEPVHEKEDYTPRDALLTKLLQRYNIKSCMPFKKRVKTPSGDLIDLVLHDFGSQVMSLLTDPRLADDDYLFFNEDPLCPPPDDLDFVNDINTGRAFIQTWKAKVRIGSNQMLLPIIWYIDGAVTGQYDHLPLTALQFTLGIFKQKTRDKPWA